MDWDIFKSLRLGRDRIRICLLFVLLSLLPTVAQAQFTFTTNADNTIAITGYTGSNTDVIIPDSTNGYPVVGIGGNAFASSAMTSVNIPTSVKEIGIYAFAGCNLTSIVIPDSVTNIGHSAFMYCGGLTNAIISTNLAYLVQNLFNFSGLKSFKIPESITNIEGGVFDGCTQLSNVTIPTNVVSIGTYAFNDCHSMTSITIPDSVKSIGDWVFSGCSAVTNLTIGESIASVPGYAFAFDTSLESVSIPNSVTNIVGTALNGCSALTNITYGSGIPMNIGDLRFAGATNINTITVVSNNPVLSSLNGVLFDKNQRALVQYPVGKIGSYTVPDSVTSIWDQAFWNCDALTDIALGKGLTSFKGFLLNGCNGLTNITISETVTNIWVGSFYNCPVLNSLTVDPSNSVYSSKDGVLFDKDQITLVQYPNGRSGNYTIPNGIAQIGYAAFYSCWGLTGVVIPDGIANIPEASFNYCTNLTNIEISASVTNIGFTAFADCPHLRNVYLKGNAPNVDTTTFETYEDPIYGTPLYVYEIMPTVYYLPWTTGWSTYYGGLPTALWLPQMQTAGTNFGGQTNQFGFNINWASDQTVVVEACTNLSNPNWQPMQTNVLPTTGSAYFSDPQWMNCPNRFYRLRSQ